MTPQHSPDGQWWWNGTAWCPAYSADRTRWWNGSTWVEVSPSHHDFLGQREYKGVNGTVSFDGTFVTIKRTGPIGRFWLGKGEKRIPLNQIVAVQWKQPGFVNGFIAFTITGAIETRAGFGRQTIAAATKDENAVIVNQGQASDFQKLREAIEEAIATRAHSPGGGTSSAAPSMADELAKLADLKNKGVLSEEEFAAQKARLLS